MKECYKCWILKDLSCYSKKSSKKDWLSWNCKDCIRIVSKEYYIKNKLIKSKIYDVYECLKIAEPLAKLK
mgnify:CR=1 FL=1